MQLGVLSHIVGDTCPYMRHTNAKRAQNGFRQLILVSISCQMLIKNFFWQFLFLPPKTLVFEGAMDWRIAAECHHEHTNALLEALKLQFRLKNHAVLLHH